VHWLDRISVGWLKRTPIFADGWGEVEPLAPYGEKLKTRAPGVGLTIQWSDPKRERGLTVQDGTAQSPAEILPASLRTMHVRRLLTPRTALRRLILPPSWGDAGYGARMWLAGALVARGLEVWLLEGAYFGVRAAPMTKVEDFFRMGLGHIEEIRALLQTHHDDQVATSLAGYSMAGQLGGMAVQSMPHDVPVVLMSCAPSPDTVFVDGPLKSQVQWAKLGEGAEAKLGDFMRRVSVLDLPAPTSVRRGVALNTGDGIVNPAATERIGAHFGVEVKRFPTGHMGAYVFWRRELQRFIAQTVLD
jgi:hypothetical protein